MEMLTGKLSGVEQLSGMILLKRDSLAFVMRLFRFVFVNVCTTHVFVDIFHLLYLFGHELKKTLWYIFSYSKLCGTSLEKCVNIC